jgi:hypothetical protein
MRYRTPSLACVGLALLLAACGGGEGGANPNPPGPGPANTAPIANAGINQTVTSGVTVMLDGLQSNDPDGTITAFTWTQTAGPAVALSSTSIARPTFVAPQVLAATTLTFSLTVTDNRGATSAASTVSIIVGLPTGSVTLSGIVRFARVPFSASFPFGLNYGSPVQQPSRGVVIRARDAITQAALATTVTDNSGGYSLVVPANTNITLQVEARVQRTSSPTWDIRVQDGTAGDSPYTFTDAQINSSAGTRNVDIPTGINPDGTAAATNPRASGPFAILDSIYQGLQTVIAVAPTTNFPGLIVDWGSQANGTFFTGGNPQHIALLADLTEDTDEFDQHVIAHEFGHYLEHNFSRADSIGGSHALGDRLDPRVAFGEGFGYAFAAIVLNDTNSRDSFNDNGTQRSGGFNIETNPATVPPATPGDQLGCWCSESSVWSILWDINDNVADANDNVALGFGPIWQVLTGPQRTTPAFTTVFSFVTALKSAGTGQNAAIDTLVSAQNITSAGMDAFATTETHSPLTPSTNALPIYTTITAGTPVVVRNVDDAGSYNKVGNHRFLRFVATTNGTVTVTLTSNNPNNADPDFQVWRAGTLMTNNSEDPPPQPETDSFTATAGTTYVLDVHDCANGCSSVQGVAGDYDLTVTIN